MTSPSAQGVRPSPRELAEQLRQQLDITESDTALLEVAITRDREQGRAEAERYRRLLERIGGPDKDDCCPVCGEHAPSCSLDAQRFPGTSACFGAEARRALAAPAATGKEPTK